MSSVSSVSDVSLPSVSSVYSDRSNQQRIIRHRRPRVFGVVTNPINIYDDEEFKKRFRLSKGSVRYVLNLITDNIKPMTARNRSISAMNQLLITLRFYACGTFHINIGDHFNVTKATVSRIVHKVSHTIARLRNRFIKMPQSLQKRREICAAFYSIAGFPNVIGAIDGSHIRVQSPGGRAAETFRNRKGYFSFNVQVICDAHLNIMDVVARWPGSAHDSHIFNNSLVRARLENNEFDDKYLLGDKGYPCRRYILTPVHNPETRAQRRYNSAHIATRNTIERTFGVLKRRFPCLSVGLRVSVNKAIPIIIATCILHNICRSRNDMIVEHERHIEQMEEGDLNLNDIQLRNNFAVRNAVINAVFQ